MAIITIADQLTLIKSHLGSIDRAMRNNDYPSIGTFFHSIATAATVAGEYADNLVAAATELPNVQTPQAGSAADAERKAD